VALSSLVYGLIESNQRSFTDGLALGCLAVAAMLLAVFVIVELRRAQPMFDMKLFKLPAFSTDGCGPGAAVIRPRATSSNTARGSKTPSSADHPAECRAAAAWTDIIRLHYPPSRALRLSPVTGRL
jgi:hypothetical protein